MASYELIKGNSFPDALEKLQKHAKNTKHPSIYIKDKLIYRPLTFKETIEAQVDHYLKHPKRSDLFRFDLATSSAILSEKNSFKSKYIPLFHNFMNMDHSYLNKLIHPDHKYYELNIYLNGDRSEKEVSILSSLLEGKVDLLSSFFHIVENELNKSLDAFLKLPSDFEYYGIDLLSVSPKNLLHSVKTTDLDSETFLLLRK